MRSGRRLENLVVDGERAGDPALTARLGPLEAQQADDVRAVGVEVLATPCPVEPHARIGARDTLVPDMAEEGGIGVLANRGADLETEPDVGQLCRLGRQLLDREPAKQDEPATFVQSLH